MVDFLGAVLDSKGALALTDVVVGNPAPPLAVTSSHADRVGHGVQFLGSVGQHV
jgi:hypothetical protein